MVKTAFCLITDTIKGLFYLFKSKLASKLKCKIFLTAFIVTFKYFTVYRLIKINQEKIFGYTIFFFDYGSFHFLFRQIFLRNEYYFASKNKQPIIFNCGSNIGLEVLYFKILFPKSTIYCIEPDPNTFELLCKNISDMKNVYTYNVALSDKKDKLDFYIDKTRPGWLTMSLDKKRMPKDKITVKSLPLSDLVGSKKIDFLTMDIEGAEYRVIEEINRKKKFNNIDQMVIEFHKKTGQTHKEFDRSLLILKENGFKLDIDTAKNNFRPGDIFQDILICAKK